MEIFPSCSNKDEAIRVVAEKENIPRDHIIGIGDSHNDLAMIQAGKDGFLFRTTDQIRKDHPELPVFDEYDDLLAAIKKVIGA